MDDKKLAAGLIKNAILSEELAQRLLTEVSQTGKSLEEVLYSRRIVDEVSVAKTKAEILGIPYQKIKPEAITDETLKIIPEETARNYKLIPLSREGNMLVVGMLDPEDTRAEEALRFVSQQNRLSLGVYLVTPSDLEMALRRYSPYQTEIQAAIRSLNIRPGAGLSSIQKSISLEAGVGGAEEAPIIKIVSSTLRAAVEQGASDVHIEPQRTRVRIRFRIDGDLREVSSFPLELHQPIISRVKILSELKIDETRVPQDGRFRTIIFNRDIDYRVSTFPTPAGEKVAIRVLDPTLGLKKIGDLGLIGKSAALIEEGIEKPFGMVLITGPTGSGKTTTLYALLQILNKESVNVLSMEDPVEYFIDGVNQSQIKPEIGYTFASGLRQAVRQDPDIIMVGEIRDNETAELAVQAALTGHIVLSTLHTNNAVGVIPRLLDMGVESFLLPSSLNLMLAQRLVRRLCSECKKPEIAPPEVQEIIKSELAKLPKEIMAEFKAKLGGKEGPYQVYHASGCKACKGKGASGRLGLFEVIKMTRELEEIVSRGPTESALKDESRRQGMVSLRQDGIMKALDGLVSIEEVLRETAET
jgi:type IV pilus assembly protein PilB